MTPTERLLLAVAIVALDALLFVVPLAALLAAWILVFRPPWFRDVVDRLYASPDS